MIVTQNTGAIKYSVSDSVEEKGTIMKRKKPPVNSWSVCEKLTIIHEESRSSTETVAMDISVLYTLMKTLLRLKL